MIPDNPIDQQPDGKMDERKYILLSNLVFGYSEWAKKIPQDNEESTDDPGSYFAGEGAEALNKLLIGLGDDYWKQRCEAAEKVIYTNDIDLESDEYNKWQQLKQSKPPITMDKNIDQAAKELSVEELLKPRILVIAGWPNMEEDEIKVGQILTDTEESFLKPDLIHKYPHLFRSLNWWEERKPEEMPKYLRYGDTDSRYTI